MSSFLSAKEIEELVKRLDPEEELKKTGKKRDNRRKQQLRS